MKYRKGKMQPSFFAGILILAASCGSGLPAQADDFTVTHTGDSGPGSFRQTILDANGRPGADRIVFDIPGDGVHTISPASPLPAITDTAVIDGATQPGYAGMPRIELEGSAINSGGLDLQGIGSEVRALIINRFLGTQISLGGTGGHTIAGCFIGTDSTGTQGFSRGGIGLAVLSAYNQIGDVSFEDRNLISGNRGWGIIIGINGCCDNRMNGNRIQGNFIGVDISGRRSLGNQGYGILLTGGSSDNLVGGTGEGEGNVISGNHGDGLALLNLTTAPNRVQGNRIGTDATGTLALGNQGNGFYISSASSHIIGGPGAAGNLIAGNRVHGIYIYNSSNIQIQANRIGTDASGRGPLGNGGHGIAVELTNNTENRNILIGGPSAVEGNIIAFNGARSGGAGVRVATGAGCAILSNAIFGNEAGGIDLGDPGVTLNDALGHNGPNRYQNFPVITGITHGAAQTLVDGNLHSQPNTRYRLDFFASDRAYASGFGQGERFLGAEEVVTGPDGNASFAVWLSGALAHGQPVTATATDAQNNTSEFSPAYPGPRLDAPLLLFRTVSPYGARPGVVYGRAYNVLPSEHRVLLYIFIPGLGWWSKPTCDERRIPLQADGTWAANITTGGVDQTATLIAAYLVPASFDPGCILGSSQLPASLDQIAVARARYFRSNPAVRNVRFSDMNWQVKASTVRIGPGNNFFSDSGDNIFVDEQGRLHLRITFAQNRWQCAEVICDEASGYGTYRFYLDSAVDSLDPNIVLGLFTWSDLAAYNHREIDIEFSRWGQVNNLNAQYVVQPYTNPQNIYRFQMPGNLPQSTHHFAWSPDNIFFQSLRGHRTAPAMPSEVIQEWLFASPGVPIPGDETPRINFWLNGGNSPQNGQEAEAVIKQVEFQPLLRQVSGIIELAESRLNGESITFSFQPQDSREAFLRSGLLGSGGTFALTDIPAGNYQVWIKGRKWLAVQIPLDVRTVNVSGLLIRLPGGDANDDNSVDVLDLDLLLQAFDSTPDHPAWNADTDFNGDNSVDVLDLDILIRAFDTVGAP